ncbi:hypothetical protein [Dactylosporangium sp. CA-139066]|uniref:hypothetical protein n=1 Tax=Dactylosporangium sp. CA-139066 TaxID=3239930 RepID=UPI003D914459
MAKRGMIVVVAAALMVGTAGCTGQPGEAQRPSACEASLQAGEAKVFTDRWDPAAELPDVGEYAEIHWQVRAAGDPCDRAVGPTDWRYQGVLKLRPEDAKVLAGMYDWGAADPSPDPQDLDDPTQMWDALKPFVPAGVHWHNSHFYDEEEPQARWRSFYFDPDLAVAWFAMYDH